MFLAFLATQNLVICSTVTITGVTVDFCPILGEDPVTIELNPPPFLDGSRFKLPIAVMASNRPSYLLRMLLGLQKVEGLDPSMITVFIDGFWPEPASVTRLVGVRLEQHAGVSRQNARICQVRKHNRFINWPLRNIAHFVFELGDYPIPSRQKCPATQD